MDYRRAVLWSYFNCCVGSENKGQEEKPISAESSLFKQLVSESLQITFLQYFQEKGVKVLINTELQISLINQEWLFPILRRENKVKWHELIGLGSKGVWQSEKALFLAICQQGMSSSPGTHHSLLEPREKPVPGSHTLLLSRSTSSLQRSWEKSQHPREAGSRQKTQDTDLTLLPLWESHLYLWPQHHLMLVKRNPGPEMQQKTK